MLYISLAYSTGFTRKCRNFHFTYKKLAPEDRSCLRRLDKAVVALWVLVVGEPYDGTEEYVRHSKSTIAEAIRSWRRTLATDCRKKRREAARTIKMEAVGLWLVAASGVRRPPPAGLRLLDCERRPMVACAYQAATSARTDSHCRIGPRALGNAWMGFGVPRPPRAVFGGRCFARYVVVFWAMAATGGFVFLGSREVGRSDLCRGQHQVACPDLGAK